MGKEKYRLTNQLNSRVNESIKEKNWEYIKKIGEELDFYIAEYKRVLACEQPQNIAYSFYELVDATIKKYNFLHEASCKKSCSFCCRIAVNVTKEEAYLLRNEYSDIVNEQQAQLNIQRSCKTPEDWDKLSYRDKACIFLGEDGACRVYKYRPISCRKYYVKSPAEQCDTISYPKGRIALLVGDEVEIIASAILNVTESKLLPEMILKAELEK